MKLNKKVKATNDSPENMFDNKCTDCLAAILYCKLRDLFYQIGSLN